MHYKLYATCWSSTIGIVNSVYELPIIITDGRAVD